VPYVTVFDISQKPFEWRWSAICLLFVVFGIVVLKYGRWLSVSKNHKVMGWCFIIFGSGAALVIFALTYSTYDEYIRAYKTGQYSIVEGVVEDFHPMPYEGHQDECFRVDKEKFCYSDYELSPAFNQSASHGGPIRAGLPVRIAYYEDENLQGHILRLEIRADSLPSGIERAAYAKGEEEKWLRWAKSDPTQYRLTLGFSFVALLISVWWTVDWKHCIRFWIRSDPPYSKLLTLGFRGFFLACLVGSSIQLVRAISERPPTIVDIEKAALYSLIGIGFFGAADLVFRWRVYRRDHSPDGRTRAPSD
jgi:hypothetical protein